MDMLQGMAVILWPLRGHWAGWENMEEWADHPCLLAQLLFLFVSEDSSLKGVTNVLMLSIRDGLSSH